MKVILTLLVLVLCINAYVHHGERAVELTSDANGNGFLCYVQTTGKDVKSGVAYIRKFLLPPKSGSAPFVKYEDVPVGITDARSCSISTYNDNGQMYVVGIFDKVTSPVLSMDAMYVPYNIDGNGVPQFGAFNYFTIYSPSTPYSFCGINIPQILVLNGSIFITFMGIDVKSSADFRMCYIYYPSLSTFSTNSYQLSCINNTAIYGYKFGNIDYYSAYIQNGVVKLYISQNNYPYGTCAVIGGCNTGVIYVDLNYLGQITNSTYKTVPTFNLGASTSRPLPGETYHNAPTDPYGGVVSSFMSYDNFIFTFSCSWNNTENRCYFNFNMLLLTQTAAVLANDATIYNGQWYIVFIDAGWIPKLYTMPTYWTGTQNFYTPRTLLIGNSTLLPIQLSPDYASKSEFGLYRFDGTAGTKIYLTYINTNFDVDIIAIY